MVVTTRYSAVFALLLSLFFVGNASAGIAVGGTRLIYHENNKEESIKVINTDEASPWLIQSWVDNNGVNDDQKATTKPPFLVAPPLFRLNADSEYALRVLRTGGKFPADRESIYWLNIKAIPAKAKKDGQPNMLQFAVRSRIKLFFRPSALTSESGLESQKLTFSRRGNQLQVNNPTGYFMTFATLTLGSQNVVTTDVLVPPHGFAVYPIPGNAKGNAVSWKVINDFGGASTKYSGNAS